MAEAMLRYRLQRADRPDIVTSSMGIHGLDAQPPSGLAQEVCSEHGLDISGHRSRQLVGQELVEADLILCMDTFQNDFVKLFFPQVAEKVSLLGSWPADGSRRDIVPDPMGRQKKLYLQVYQLLDRHISRILPIIQEMHPLR